MSAPRSNETLLFVVLGGFLLGLAVVDWFAGETVRITVRRGNDPPAVIRTDYGWSGLEYFERVETDGN